MALKSDPPSIAYDLTILNLLIVNQVYNRIDPLYIVNRFDSKWKRFVRDIGTIKLIKNQSQFLRFRFLSIMSLSCLYEK